MRWLELTTTEIEDACQRAGRVAMIPIGSIETHGPHLPLGCDSIVIERVADLVAAEEPVVVLPVMACTWSPQARRHPGNVTIGSRDLVAFLEDLCDEIARNGFEKIVLLHGHGGNIPMDSLFLGHVLERGKPYTVYSIGPWAGLGAEDLPRERQRAAIGHACHVETSIFMAVREGLVNLDALRGVDIRARETLDVGAAATSVDWIERHPYGVVGDPTLATLELGQRLLQNWVSSVVSTLRLIKADQVAPGVVSEISRARV